MITSGKTGFVGCNPITKLDTLLTSLDTLILYQAKLNTMSTLAVSYIIVVITRIIKYIIPVFSIINLPIIDKT